ncbi:MAG: hypothetical protein ACXWC9_06370, partial [Pseudobdellovibrionaceae bacterium]
PVLAFHAAETVVLNSCRYQTSILPAEQAFNAPGLEVSRVQLYYRFTCENQSEQTFLDRSRNDRP